MVQTLIRLPFSGAITVSQGMGGSYSHAGNTSYAYDFAMQFGQSVLAVAAGRVVALRETVPDGGAASYPGDPSLGSSNIGNFVTLEHQINGQTFYSSYFHLRQSSVPLQIGQMVGEGDVLGQVGNTGSRSGTHLHFQIGQSPVQWTAGIVADAGNTTANADLAASLRFVGFDGQTSLASLAAGSRVTGDSGGDFAANTGTEAILALHSPGSGSIGLARDMDWFRIEVQAGQKYVLALENVAGSNLDAFLRLYNANGRWLASNDDGGPDDTARITFTANQSGVLYASAGGYGNTTGGYSLALSPLGVTRGGGSGADRLTGTGAADQISGRAGDDVLAGGGSRDQVFGGAGNDRIYGGTGGDWLAGGTGRDRILGGGGADTFVFRQGDGVDRLVDFADGRDQIRLYGVADFAALHLTAQSTGTWLDYGDGRVFLYGITPGQIDASDFIFA